MDEICSICQPNLESVKIIRSFPTRTPGLIAVDPTNGNVIIANLDDGGYIINRYAKDGTFINKVSTVETILDSGVIPGGICIDSVGDMYIANGYTNKIQKLSPDGDILLEFGSNCLSPIGIGVNSQKQIVVASYMDHKINVFNHDGIFLFSFGEYGSGPGQLNMPTNIAIDKNDNVYVVDDNDNGIRVFSAKGHYLHAFEQFMSDNKILTPNFITITNKGYVVTNYGCFDGLGVFNCEGKLQFGCGNEDETLTSGLDAITSDSDGNVLIHFAFEHVNVLEIH